jgi:hypothetical protein
MAFRGVIVAVIVWFQSLVPASSEVVVELSAAKPLYAVGDQIRLNLRYTNRGREAITLLPKFPTDPGEWFSFVRVEDRRSAQLINDFEAPWIDDETLSKQTVVLQPGRSVLRTIRARLERSLPDYLLRQQRGLFVIFPGTAVLQLPGPGRYDVSATYRSPRDNPIKKYLRKRPRLWEGTVTTNSIYVEIRAHSERGRMPPVIK